MASGTSTYPLSKTNASELMPAMTRVAECLPSHAATIRGSTTNFRSPWLACTVKPPPGRFTRRTVVPRCRRTPGSRSSCPSSAWVSATTGTDIAYGTGALGTSRYSRAATSAPST